MRTFEILLALLVAASALAALWQRTPRRLLSGLLLLDLFVLLLHAVFEGPHWQMAPAYLAVLLFAAAFAFQRLMIQRIFAVAMLLLTLGTCAASAMLPMFKLPAPTGPYAIGTRILTVVNDHPSDPSSANSTGKRELVVQVWYPAAPSHAPRAPYRKLAETNLISSYQAVLWTHSRWNAPFAQSSNPFPLLLLNPAWGGRRTYYTYLVEELASHGYIVAGIDHTGNSGPTAFPDGHVEQPDLGQGIDFETHTFDQLKAYAAKQQEIQVDDDRFVLDQFQRWNGDQTGPFYRRVDMDRIGALGHSIGGSVAAQASLEDSRIKSALDMDGSFWGQIQQVGSAKPFMMIEEDVTQFTPAELQRDRGALIDHLLDLGDTTMMQKSNGYQITLHGSTHPSFTDRSLFSPRKSSSGAGTIPVEREYAILRTYVLAFFDKTLRGVDPAILRSTDQPFPEVSFRFLHRQ
jgi:predicted dienelactone hydrolase